MDPYLLLAAAEGCEPGLVPALLDPASDPTDLLRRAAAAADDDIGADDRGPSLPPRVLRRLRSSDLSKVAAEWLERAHQHGLLLLTPADDRYSASLREVALRPNALFVRGDCSALQASPSVAVVGSRTPTPYGQDAAQQFAHALAGVGATLWSGLARGVDAIAHRACLDAGRRTVAVLAGGLDRIYPPEHDALAAEIVAHGGCLVAELPPGARAQRGHFPRRNRILAAAESALVVEAGRTSGALQTARFAAEQGRPVFAVPGPWTSERSRGCHDLLREGAQVAADPAELLRDLGVTAAVEPAAAHGMQATADEVALLRALASGPRPADLAQRESGLDRTRFLQARFRLEQHGAVRTMPGDLLAATGCGRSAAQHGC